ncbi:SEL1-like repeat protein [Sphingomonas sp.]|uniref:SEL1-like repeat protein n=1 Tax=Sphingomonas sp. TaxID=28214 RepID=UPI002FD8E8C3
MDRKLGRLAAPLLAGASIFLAIPASAQTDAQKQQDVIIRAQRMPAAEAQRSAMCEALARNPYFAALSSAAAGKDVLGPTVYLPTRLPRNPDYTAPPLVPPGSPLPTPPKSRFGTLALFSGALNDANGTADSSGDGSAADGNGVGSTPTPATTSADEIAAACRTRYQPNAGSPEVTSRPASIPIEFSGPTGKTDTRASRILHDDTLPIAILLFDQRRFAESLPWFKRAANKLPLGAGGDEAALYIGKLYLMGLGEQSDPSEGVRWLEKAATARFNPITDTPMFNPEVPELNTASGEASVILGNVYRTGYKGIPRNPEASRKWFARALENGHVPAAKMLGDLYRDGIDVPRDPAKAASYYRQAAKLDLPSAQVALAQMLETGDDGVQQDRPQAIAWYRAAARHEHPEALYALARAFDLGEGVKADPEQALGLYKRAAIAGSAGAMTALGTYFYEGRQVAKDPVAARRWFEQGAKRGDADGMVDLAAMQIQGQGGDKDVVQAWVWLKRATTLRHQAAPNAVAVLERRMSPAERAAAQSALERR